MRKVTLLVVMLVGVFFTTYAQESFKKKYSIRPYLAFRGSDTVWLEKESITPFNKIKDSIKNKIVEEYKRGQSITITKEFIVDGEKATITRQDSVNEKFYERLSMLIHEPIEKEVARKFKGYVKLEENKLYVNRFLKIDSGKYTRREIYYFKLKNRQTARIAFNEFTVSTLLIPIKYRFGHGEIPEDFSSGFNANFFFGRSFGKTRFHYREKVDNVINTWKVTLGILAGASVTELNASNTKYADAPLTGDTKFSKGVASLGGGGTYAYNKINIGVFLGWDFAIGESASKWNYNKRPWLGIAIGYSLFNWN